MQRASLPVRAAPNRLLVVLLNGGVALPVVEGLHWAGANGRDPRECYAGCGPDGHGRAPRVARPGHPLAFSQWLDDRAAVLKGPSCLFSAQILPHTSRRLRGHGSEVVIRPTIAFNELNGINEIASLHLSAEPRQDSRNGRKSVTCFRRATRGRN